MKSILDAIKPILTIALLCFAAYALILAGPGVLPFLKGIAWLPATVAGASATTLGYIALGAAIILDPDGVADVAGGVADTIGTVAGAVVSGAVGGLLTGVTGGSSLLGWAALAAAAWFIFFRKKDKDDERKKEGDDSDKCSAPRERQIETEPSKSTVTTPSPIRNKDFKYV